MEKVIQWKKINRYFLEKKLNEIRNKPFDFVKMLMINNTIDYSNSKYNFESFMDCARKDYFTLSDLQNLNFSKNFIDCVAIAKYFSNQDIELISNMHSEEAKAITVIGRCYAEQFDKSGNSLAGHSVRISKCLEKEEERIVALLHDIVEDEYLTFNNLRRFGFSKSIIETLKVLTRNKNKYPEYGDYINSIISSKNLIALKVKFWDMQDNQSPYRVRDLNEAKKYKATHKYKPYIPLVLLAIKELEEEQRLEKKLRLIK